MVGKGAIPLDIPRPGRTFKPAFEGTGRPRVWNFHAATPMTSVCFVWLMYTAPFLQGALGLVLKLVILSYSHSVHLRSFKPHDDIYPDVRNPSSLNSKSTWLLSLHPEPGQLTARPFPRRCQSFMLPCEPCSPEVLTRSWCLFTLALGFAIIKAIRPQRAVPWHTTVPHSPSLWHTELPSQTWAIGLLIQKPSMVPSKDNTAMLSPHSLPPPCPHQRLFLLTGLEPPACTRVCA